MKILLDECVTKKLKPFLNEHEVYSVSQMRWNGLRNGNLIQKAISEGFDIILTIDKNISYQQNISKYNLIISIWNTKSSKIEDIISFLPKFKEQIFIYKKGNIYILN